MGDIFENNFGGLTDGFGSSMDGGSGCGMGDDWHNNWGTSADFEVPASSGDAFQSWDWSTWG